MNNIEIGWGSILTFWTIILGIFSQPLLSQFKHIKTIRKAAVLMDDFNVEIDTLQKPIKISKLRKHEKLGDKIVLAHYLSGLIKDILKKIHQTLTYSTLGAIVLQFTLFFFNITSENTQTKELLNKLQHLPVLGVLFLVIIQTLFVLQIFQDQAHKFDEVIKEARALEIKKEPWIIRFIRFGKK